MAMRKVTDADNEIRYLPKELEAPLGYILMLLAS